MDRRASSLVAAGALALALSASAEAACPRLIMISGEPLPEPIVISNWDNACRLYASFFRGSPAGPIRIERRRSLRLGLFWYGPAWEPYVRDDRLGELEPGQANQVGQLYPARGRTAALVDLSGYGLLEDLGVATRLDESDARGRPWIAVGVIGVTALALPLLLFALRSRRKPVKSY